jgi:hypothetical protein
MNDVREQLRTALGIRQGTNRSGAARHSWRGLFVELHAHVKRLTMATYALVVTDPVYARKRSYQHLIPLVAAGAGLPVIPGSLRIEKEWLKNLDPSYEVAYLVIPSLFSGSERDRPEVPGMIMQPTAVCADGETIEQVEDGLIAHFDL